jgi:two-component system capsular synthesis sensor histidine kinase RcsC
VKILYIEDTPLDADLVQRYMGTTSHHLITVPTIEAARQALDDPPDLILMDILLDKTRSGYDFARELRRDGYMQPIIAVTALALPKDIELCYQSGFTDVLAKPYELKHLAALLRKYVS